MRRLSTTLALVWLLLAQPVWGFDLVKIATIPRGNINYYQFPVGDLDHDGRPELYFEQSTSPFSLNIWEHWGNNSYQPVKILEECGMPNTVGDADQDGLSDLLCHEFYPTLLESSTPEAFPSQVVWRGPKAFSGFLGYLVDTDQDGKQEIWIVPYSDPEVWENQGDNTYVQVATLPVTRQILTLAFGDFDGDGRTDIVVGSPGSFISVWETTGDDTWELVWTYEFLDDWESDIVAAAHDLDGDGTPEFLVAGQIFSGNCKLIGTCPHVVTIFETTGDNAYAPIWRHRGQGSFFHTHLAVGDIDGDGLEEFAVEIPGAVQLYKAFGDNKFRLIEEVPYSRDVALGDFAIHLADLNRNGVAELIVNSPITGPILISIYELAKLQPTVLIQGFYPLGPYEVNAGEKLIGWLAVFNRTREKRLIDAWLEVYEGTGEGGPKGKPSFTKDIFHQKRFLPHRHWRTAFQLKLPDQPGPYTVQLKVGTFPDQVVDTRWFTVSVGLRPPGAGPPGAKGNEEGAAIEPWCKPSG